MSLPTLSPERRSQLLSHPDRAEFYKQLKAQWGEAVAERYLQTCDRPHRRVQNKVNPQASRPIGVVLGFLGLLSLTSCASVIGDYGSGLTGEVSHTSGITTDELLGAIGGLAKGGAGQVYQSSGSLPPESPGVREQHGSVDREGCRRMAERFRSEGRAVRLVDIVENYLASPGQRTFNYICIFEGASSEPGYYGNYPYGGKQ
jgi:hypothetical protein